MVKPCTEKDIKYIVDRLSKYDADMIAPTDNIAYKNLVSAKFAYFDKGRPIGFIQLMRLSKPSEENPLCINIAVLKDYRGKGVADALLNEAIKYFKRSEFKQLRWKCDKNNIPSMKFAEKHGFDVKYTTDTDWILVYNEKNAGGVMEGYMDGIIDSVMERMKSIPMFISNDDLEINVDKWKAGKIKDLYILGLSGSGKSTLSRRMVKQFPKASLIELDLFMNTRHINNDTNDGTIKAYAENEYGSLEEFIKWIKNRFTGTLTNDSTSFEIYLQEYVKYGKFLRYEWNKQCILEGVDVIQMVRYAKDDLFKENEFAIIIKGTSVTKSFIQKFKRDGGFNENGLKPSEIVDYLLHYYVRYNGWRDGINHVIDDLT